jgi:transposase InsO family protein
MRLQPSEQQQALVVLSQAVAAAAAEKPRKTRKHKYSSSCHHTRNQPVAPATEANVPVSQPVAVSVLARPRSVSPPTSSMSSSPSSALSSVHTQDFRTFQEVLNTSLVQKNPKRIGKVITDERFARLVIACGLPENDKSVTKSEREAIKYNKYVAGADGRLFAWKPEKEKEDVATATWPSDMYEVVRFSDIARVISKEHSDLAGAKAERMWASLRHKYKGITYDMCKQFCRHCPGCAASQVDKLVKKKKKIKAILAKGVWYKITFDLISMINMPGGHGKYNYILTAVDHFSKYAYAWALESKTSEGVEQELRRMFMMFGYPRSCQADNGSEFKGMVAELLKEKAVIYTHGQPYKPQTQGVVERFNQTIQDRIASIMHEVGEQDWFNVLDQAVGSYNTTPHSATNHTPYKIMYGQDPHTRQATTVQAPAQEHEQEQEQEQAQHQEWEQDETELEHKHTAENTTPHAAIRAEAHATYVSQAQKMERRYNKHVTSITTYDVGQYVSVPIEMGDHPNRLSYDNIGGVVIQRTKHNSYRILTAHGMLMSPMMPDQFMLANPSQHPNLWSHAAKWSSPEACEHTVSNEPGYTMIEIHSKICSETGITARLRMFKDQKRKKQKTQHKHQAKTKANGGTRKNNGNGNRNGKGKGKRKGKGTDTDSSSSAADSDCGSVDVAADAGARVDVGVGVYVGRGIPEAILNERYVSGVKQYLITWLNKPESFDSWQFASEFDDGAYDGAFVELVAEWEEYKKTDPQYSTTTTTTTTTTQPTTTTQATAKANAKATSSSSSSSSRSGRGKRKRSDSVHSVEY